MMKRLTVQTFLETLTTGISRPNIVLGDDYEEYILKSEYMHIEDRMIKGNCIFLNEALVYGLGKILGIPMPEAVILTIDEYLLNLDRSLIFKHKVTEESVCFGSKRLEYVENNILENQLKLIEMGKPYIARSWNAFFKGINNKEDASKIIALDFLVGNFDRFKNPGNLLISSVHDKRNIYAIDHGHAFCGPVWNDTKISFLSNDNYDTEYIISYIEQYRVIGEGYTSLGLGRIFTELEKFVDLNNLNDHSFMDIISKIESITDEDLDSIFESIPDEWFISRELQINYYREFILNQKMIVRDIIQILAYKDAFTNYRGGLLEWKKEAKLGIV